MAYPDRWTGGAWPVRSIAAILLAGFAVWSCVAAAQPAIEPRLRIGLAAMPTSLDPHQHNFTPNQTVAFHRFDPLVWRDADNRMRPRLAVSWQETLPRQWVFRLQEGVRFHDGRRFTARDVVYSYCRADSIENGRLSFAPLLRDIDRIVALRPDTVRIGFSRQFTEPPFVLAGIAIVAAPAAFPARAEFRRDGCFDDAGRPLDMAAFTAPPVGSGPYMLDPPAQTDLREIALRRSPAYWGVQPPWPMVVLAVIEDDERRVRALSDGTADLIEQVPPGSIAALRTGGFTIVSVAANRLIHLQMEQRRDNLSDLQDTDGRNPFKDVRVRQAISLAIDRQALVARVMGGFATPAWQLLRGDMAGFAADLNGVYDLPSARRLLAEAGYGGGFAVRLLTPDGRYANDRRVAEAVGAMLLPLGIRVSVEAAAPSDFFVIRTRDRAAFFLSGNAISMAATALRALALTPVPDHGRGTSNHGGYSNPEVDRLFDQAMTVTAQGEQEHLLGAANRLASRDMAVIPLFYSQTIWGLRPGLVLGPRPDQLTLATMVLRR